MKFEDFGLSSELSAAIKNLRFTKPTQIQERSIPPILAGKDVLGESETGSGKTLAFACGIIEKVVPKQGIQALVLTPTRELTEQVKNSIRELSSQKRFSVLAVYGGVSMSPQIDGLSRAEVVVATPGRLLDHLQRRTIDLSKVKILVLDEADRMLDMGFIEDVENIIKHCPAQRQTLFFSATISSLILDLGNEFLNRPVKIFAGKQVDPSKLKQVYYDVAKNQKLSLLVHLLEKETSGLAMVFCNTRSTTDFVLRNLKANKVDAIAIHGGLSQNKRTRIIQGFNNAKFGVLVCTDVAARGLHIENVSHIFNYEVPKDPKDYVHRIGRTARAGEEGIAVNFISDQDHGNFGRILHEYNTFNVDNVKLPYLKRITFVRTERNRGNFRNQGRPGNNSGGSWRRPGRGWRHN